ncbi:MAG: glycoside hydrolase domain-containing protein [Ilumatobacter sp.]
MIDSVDPFIGTGITDLADPSGLAATWFWPKPPVGNTHPGATHPFGMLSACAYSGGYPTGYGSFERSTEGPPRRLHQGNVASGFTHFQQSGTGAIRKYYNYLRVTPTLGTLDDLGEPVAIVDEDAAPGWYTATLASGIRADLTVGPKSAVHRYTFPSSRTARIIIDCSHGGLTIDRGATIPLRASLDIAGPGVVTGHVVMEGVPIAFHIECNTPDWRQMLWYDRRLMPGGSQLQFDSIRPTTLRPFGFVWTGPIDAGDTVEVRIGFSLRDHDQARRNLERDLSTEGSRERHATEQRFASRREHTRAAWAGHLDRVRIETSSPQRRSVFATALYHSLIKPCFAPDESPFWPSDGPFAFDICTMWDIYRTQLPLITALFPERAVELATALLQVAEEEGNLPIGYRMARGADRFFRQGSALAHTFLADLCALGLPGIDWEWALCHMDADLRRQFGEEYLEHGVVHPISHTLDLAFGYHCTATVARIVGDDDLAAQFEALATRWVNAFDPDSGLVLDSNLYEGGTWNYSFRLVHDMAGRIEVAGGEAAYTELLDEFFGFGAPPVKQLGVDPAAEEIAAGYGLNRFEGLNNEPDMEAPWSYHWVGRPDRTAQIVHAGVHQQFGLGRGGLPGNDDSGALSSWYVWASLGLFPVAGQQIVLINAPSFVRARLRLGNKTLDIETIGFEEPDVDSAPQYVQEVHFNGVAIDRSWLTNAEFHGGGLLTIALGTEPSTWATTTRPPSRSTHHLSHSDSPIDLPSQEQQP